MTPTQNAIVAFVLDYHDRHPYGPSLRDIADHVGVTHQAIHKQVQILQAAGILRHDVSIARSVAIIQPPKDIAQSETPDTLQTDSGSGEAMPTVTGTL